MNNKIEDISNVNNEDYDENILDIKFNIPDGLYNNLDSLKSTIENQLNINKIHIIIERKNNRLRLKYTANREKFKHC